MLPFFQWITYCPSYHSAIRHSLHIFRQWNTLDNREEYSVKFHLHLLITDVITTICINQLSWARNSKVGWIPTWIFLVRFILISLIPLTSCMPFFDSFDKVLARHLIIITNRKASWCHRIENHDINLTRLCTPKIMPIAIQRFMQILSPHFQSIRLRRLHRSALVYQSLCIIKDGRNRHGVSTPCKEHTPINVFSLILNKPSQCIHRLLNGFFSN